MVEFADTPAEAAFRAEVRSFVEEHCPAELIAEAPYADTLGTDHVGPVGEPERERLRARWREALTERGWIAPHWPKEYGGGALSTMEQFILNDEVARMRAPRMGVPAVGSTIMVHGSEEQKREFLPPMLRGETRWCQGYSEPGSGSDLASLQTRAVRDGDDFVINGQKIWTSGAWGADWMFGLVRTDPEAPKHRGITYLLIDMKTPGIDVHRLQQMSDCMRFNEVFFEDVRVPVKNAVGEVNRGWYVGATHLDFERSGIGDGAGVHNMCADLIGFLKDERDAGSGRQRLGEQAVRQSLADNAIGVEMAVLYSYRVISMQNRGQIPNYEASTAKVFRTEQSQRLALAAVKALGLYGLLFDIENPYTPMRTKWSRFYLGAASETIGAGTSEIQRNIIATRGLGLPRG